MGCGGIYNMEFFIYSHCIGMNDFDNVVVIKTNNMYLILKQVSICTEHGCSVSYGTVLC